MNTCSRCGNVAHTKLLFVMPPNGHSLPSLTQPGFTPSTTVRVCANCITDDEIMRELSPVVDFALGVLLSNAAQEPHPQVDHIRSLEMTRSFFMVRNVDTHSRNAALRVLGFIRLKNLHSKNPPPTPYSLASTNRFNVLRATAASQWFVKNSLSPS